LAQTLSIRASLRYKLNIVRVSALWGSGFAGPAVAQVQDASELSHIFQAPSLGTGAKFSSGLLPAMACDPTAGPRAQNPGSGGNTCPGTLRSRGSRYCPSNRPAGMRVRDGPLGPDREHHSPCTAARIERLGEPLDTLLAPEPLKNQHFRPPLNKPEGSRVPILGQKSGPNLVEERTGGKLPVWSAGATWTECTGRKYKAGTQNVNECVMARRF
jgi:hypothetical protein